jgi:hypothetical protein
VSELTVGADFNGPDYVAEFDKARLTGQLLRVFDCMADGRWRTLEEIARVTGDPPASVSAQLRHLRKPKFGGHVVVKQARGERRHGLWEYQLVLPRPRGQQLGLFERAAS